MPAPKNELSSCTADYMVFGSDTVVFTIELASHMHLTDPAVVQRCMDEYMAFYGHSVSGWAANAGDGILTITVTGRVNSVA